MPAYTTSVRTEPVEVLASASTEPVLSLSKGSAPTVSLSPSRRAWLRFKKSKLGFWSLVIFSTLVVLSLFADVLSTDKPLVVSKQTEHHKRRKNDQTPETEFALFKAQPGALGGGK